MFQTFLFCDSRPVFITFFQIRVPFWLPFWILYCNYFESDFQPQKIQKIGITFAFPSGLPRTHHRRGGNQEPKGNLEAKCIFSFIFVSKSGAIEHFRVDGRDPTIPVYRACTQKFANIEGEIMRLPDTKYRRYTARTSTADADWGILYIYIYTHIHIYEVVQMILHRSQEAFGCLPFWFRSISVLLYSLEPKRTQTIHTC